MKTEIEINGFKITVEDIEGKIEVKAEMNDEVIEEMTLDPSEYENGSEDEEELKAFGDDDEDDDDEERDETETESEDEEEDEMMEESIKSFSDMFPIK